MFTVRLLPDWIAVLYNDAIQASVAAAFNNRVRSPIFDIPTLRSSVSVIDYARQGTSAAGA